MIGAWSSASSFALSGFCQPPPPPEGTSCVFGSLPAFSCRSNQHTFRLQFHMMHVIDSVCERHVTFQSSKSRCGLLYTPSLRLTFLKEGRFTGLGTLSFLSVSEEAVRGFCTHLQAFVVEFSKPIRWKCFASSRPCPPLKQQTAKQHVQRLQKLLCSRIKVHKGQPLSAKQPADLARDGLACLGSAQGHQSRTIALSEWPRRAGARGPSTSQGTTYCAIPIPIAAAPLSRHSAFPRPPPRSRPNIEPWEPLVGICSLLGPAADS